MLLLVLNFLALCTAAWTCDCKLVDAMAQHIQTDAGNSVELLCDVPTSWPDNVIVTWTKYPAEKLSSGLTLLVNESRYDVQRREVGEYNLKIYNVSAVDDGKYYCKFSFSEGDDTSIIKVYRLKVNQANRNHSRSGSDGHKGKKISASSKSSKTEHSKRSTSPRPSTSSWNRNKTYYNSSADYDYRRNSSARPSNTTSWRRNNTASNNSSYDWRRSTPSWTRNSSSYLNTTKRYDQKPQKWTRNYTAYNNSYDYRRNSSARPDNSWIKYTTTKYDSRRNKTYWTTAPWWRNNTRNVNNNTSGNNSTMRGWTTARWSNSTRWTPKANASASAVPVKTTPRSAGLKTSPNTTTKVMTTVRRSSRLAQANTTVATTRAATSRTTTKRNSRG